MHTLTITMTGHLIDYLFHEMDEKYKQFIISENEIKIEYANDYKICDDAFYFNGLIFTLNIGGIKSSAKIEMFDSENGLTNILNYTSECK